MHLVGIDLLAAVGETRAGGDGALGDLCRNVGQRTSGGEGLAACLLGGHRRFLRVWGWALRRRDPRIPNGGPYRTWAAERRGDQSRFAR